MSTAGAMAANGSKLLAETFSASRLMRGLEGVALWIDLFAGPIRVFRRGVIAVSGALRRLFWAVFRPTLPSHYALITLIVCSIAHGSLRFGSRSYRAWCDRVGVWYTTRIASFLTTANGRSVRNEFQTAMRSVMKHAESYNLTPANHPHPDAATHRTWAKTVMTEVASAIGRQIYDVSPSEHDSFLPGTRMYYNIKDLNIEARDDGPPDSRKHIIRMVDVDYYADMYYWMSFGCPMMLYSFMPEVLSGSELNSTWRFNVHNQVEMIVSGGEVYKHQLWNWHYATIAVDYWYGTWVYDCESYYLGPPEDRATPRNKRVVFLHPRSFTWAPLGWLLPGQRLGLFQPCQDSNTFRLDVVNMKGTRLSSIGLSTGGSCELLTDDLERLIRWYARRPDDTSSATVERCLREVNTDAVAVASDAKLLLLWLEEHVVQYPPIVTSHFHNRQKFTPGELAAHYQTLTPLVNEEGKKYARMITPRLCDFPGVPCESYNNDHATVEGRIEKVRNTVRPSPKYTGYLDEFVNLVVPKELVGTGQPLDPEEVNLRQSEPRQRQRYALWSRTTGLEGFRVKAFQKRESYPTFNDPRNISTVPTDHTVRLSAFALPMSEVLLKGKTKGQPLHWYVPGMTPLQIGEAVHDFVHPRQSINCVDYSRLDGSISEFLRQVESAVYLRYFGNAYSKELMKLLANEYMASARTKHGIKYITGHSRLSGSPITTDGNTIICAYVSYCINRNSGMDSRSAYKHIGLIYGDDGILPRTDEVTAPRTAADLGLTLKVEAVSCGRSFKFLGRLFIDPWFSTVSCQDPRRCIPRLHLTMTTESNVPIDIAANYRADGYLVTDCNTPIIGNWCRYVKRRYPLKAPIPYEKYKMYLDLDRPFCASDGSWRQAPYNDPMLLDAVAADLETDVSSVRVWCDLLDRSVLENPWPNIPIYTEVKVNCEVAGEIRSRPGAHKNDKLLRPEHSTSTERQPTDTQDASDTDGIGLVQRNVVRANSQSSNPPGTDQRLLCQTSGASSVHGELSTSSRLSTGGDSLRRGPAIHTIADSVHSSRLPARYIHPSGLLKDGSDVHVSGVQQGIQGPVVLSAAPAGCSFQHIVGRKAAATPRSPRKKSVYGGCVAAAGQSKRAQKRAARANEHGRKARAP